MAKNRNRAKQDSPETFTPDEARAPELGLVPEPDDGTLPFAAGDDDELGDHVQGVADIAFGAVDEPPEEPSHIEETEALRTALDDAEQRALNLVVQLTERDQQVIERDERMSGLEYDLARVRDENDTFAAQWKNLTRASIWEVSFPSVRVWVAASDISEAIAKAQAKHPNQKITSVKAAGFDLVV